MNAELLKEYAELKIQEKSIKERIDELNPLVKEEVLSQGIDKLPTNLGNFIIKKIKKWTYSKTVEDAVKHLEELKAFEQAHGKATFVEVEQLEFRQLKHE